MPGRTGPSRAQVASPTRWRRSVSTTAGRACCPPAGALERILEHSGYLALAATTPGGVDAGDVLHAVDRVRQVVEDGGSLADAADALEADREATSEVESLPLEPGRTDVVRLMNLHKAKGLEADVVFLADPAGGVKPRVDVHIERTRLNRRVGWLKIVGSRDVVRQQRCSASTPTGPRTRPPNCRTSRRKKTVCSMSRPLVRARCSSSAGRCHRRVLPRGVS